MEEKRILFIGMKPKKTLARYVECELEKWISQEQSALMPERAEYRVEVACEEVHPYYQCSVEVGFGPYKLRSNEGGKTLQAALSNALRRMRVVATPMYRTRPHAQASSTQNVA